MAPDNTQIRINRLVRAYRSYNEKIEETRARARQFAGEKAETVARLRELMPAADVASLLGVSQAAVYAMLTEARPPANISPEMHERLAGGPHPEDFKGTDEVLR